MFRYASWLAVSSVQQIRTSDGEDKESLPNQERQCRAAGQGKGWQDTGLIYTVPGHSRTRYVNLRDAEMDIPALRDMLEGARKGQFNLLVMYDLNRLRDLLQPVAKTLQSYGVQIFSVNQPFELQPPDKINPYASSSPRIVMNVSQLVSDEQIADLQRKYRTGNSARTEKGLHSLNVPWGYRVINKKIPAEQVPEIVAIILRVKKLFWDGLNYTEIADTFNREYIPSPRGSVWGHSTIRSILSEQYYAGKVYFGRLKATRDYDLNRYNIRANPDVEFKDGKHKPIWSWNEHLEIVAEMEKRARRPRRDYVFSGLLWCSVCGDRLFKSASYNGWVCKKYCTGLKNYEVNAIVCAALQKTLGEAPVEPVENFENVMSGELENLQTQRRRVQELFKKGSPIYTEAEAEKEIVELDARIKAYQVDEANLELQRARQEMYVQTIDTWRRKLEYLPGMIAQEDPKEMNRVLRQLCKRVVVTPGGKLTVELWI